MAITSDADARKVRDRLAQAEQTAARLGDELAQIEGAIGDALVRDDHKAFGVESARRATAEREKADAARLAAALRRDLAAWEAAESDRRRERAAARLAAARQADAAAEAAQWDDLTRAIVASKTRTATRGELVAARAEAARSGVADLGPRPSLLLLPDLPPDVWADPAAARARRAAPTPPWKPYPIGPQPGQAGVEPPPEQRGQVLAVFPYDPILGAVGTPVDDGAGVGSLLSR